MALSTSRFKEIPHAVQSQTDSLDLQVKEYIDDIFLNITRITITSLSAFFLFSAFWIGASQPAQYLTPVMLTSFFVILLGWISNRLLQEHPKLSAASWQAGMFITIAVALVSFQWPFLVLFYGILPLIAVITVGWQFGIVINGLMVITVVGLSRYPHIFMVPQDYSIAL